MTKDELELFKRVIDVGERLFQETATEFAYCENKGGFFGVADVLGDWRKIKKEAVKFISKQEVKE